MACVSGPVVAELEAAFLTDWYSETGILLDRQKAPETTFEPEASGDMLYQVLPSGSGFQNENNLKLFTSPYEPAAGSAAGVGAWARLPN